MAGDTDALRYFLGVVSEADSLDLAVDFVRDLLYQPCYQPRSECDALACPMTWLLFWQRTASFNDRSW
jgi:hypothetical protein